MKLWITPTFAAVLISCGGGSASSGSDGHVTIVRPAPEVSNSAGQSSAKAAPIPTTERRVETLDEHCARTRARRVADAKAAIRLHWDRWKQISPLYKFAATHHCQIDDTAIKCDTKKTPPDLTHAAMEEIARFDEERRAKWSGIESDPPCDDRETPSLRARWSDEASQKAILDLPEDAATR